MKGLILTNAYSLLPQVEYQCARLKEEFSKLGVSVVAAKNCSPAFIKDGEICRLEEDFDFCVYLDKDKYASHMLEKSGLRLFNRAAAIEKCDDKMSTAITLAGSGIPLPETLPAPLCYREGASPLHSLLDKAELLLGYPMVVKSCYGSMGNGVFKAENRAQLNEICSRLVMSPHLFQKFVAESAGRDLRVIVVGGKAIACMERKSESDFRSNLAAGGKGSKAELSSEIRQIAEKAASLLDLDYCGVDILTGKNCLYLCEVNSNAFFDGIERITGVNVARAFAEHILSSISPRPCR